MSWLPYKLLTLQSILFFFHFLHNQQSRYQQYLVTANFCRNYPLSMNQQSQQGQAAQAQSDQGQQAQPQAPLQAVQAEQMVYRPPTTTLTFLASANGINISANSLNLALP